MAFPPSGATTETIICNSILHRVCAFQLSYLRPWTHETNVLFVVAWKKWLNPLRNPVYWFNINRDIHKIIEHPSVLGQCEKNILVLTLTSSILKMYTIPFWVAGAYPSQCWVKAGCILDVSPVHTLTSTPIRRI